MTKGMIGDAQRSVQRMCVGDCFDGDLEVFRSSNFMCLDVFG